MKILKNERLFLGIGTDLDICDKVDNVDVVVGGHSNTFLWTGDLPEGPVIDEEVCFCLISNTRI